MDKVKISEIGQRSNIIHKISSQSDVVIYEDHRTILNVLYFLSNKGGFTAPLDIVLFDNHEDFCHPRETTIPKINEFLQNPSREGLNTIVEFDLSTLDDDWIKVGMELGLIGNVFLFNSEKSFVGFKEEYVTQKFGTKSLYNLGEVWAALGYHGILSDTVKREYQPLWDDFGWELNEGKFSFKKERKKFVFDIDLDCFSTRILDKTIAIPEEIIIQRLTEYSRQDSHYYSCAQDFMKQLIKDSELVTLCFENGCCGGIRQAHKIFNMVDEVLFDNELGD